MNCLTPFNLVYDVSVYRENGESEGKVSNADLQERD